MSLVALSLLLTAGYHLSAPPACVPTRHTGRFATSRAAPLHMIANAQPLREFLDLWDDDEDGDSNTCMTTMALEFLADRVEAHHDLLPDLEVVFDEVLGECDEACVTVNKLKEYLSR